MSLYLGEKPTVSNSLTRATRFGGSGGFIGFGAMFFIGGAIPHRQSPSTW